MLKLPSFSSSVSVVFPPKLVSLFQHLSFCFTNPFCWQICAILFIPPQLYACRAISTYLFTITNDDLTLNYYRVGFSRIILRVPGSNTRRRVLLASITPE